MTQAAVGDPVTLEVHGGIATVVLNRPDRHNAMSVESWRLVAERVRAADKDPDVGVIVLRGAGERAFCAGADIHEFEEHRSTPEKAHAYAELVAAAMNALTAVHKPLIALIYGYCLGGGCEMAICADIRVAAEDAVFGIPAARLGLAIHLEDIQRLVRLVGPANAKLMLFSGQRFSARRAHAMGLVTEVVPADDLERHTYQLADEIRRAAPTSVRWSKEAVARVLDDPTLESFPDRFERAAALFATEDFLEGVRAFKEKREPRFTGR